MSAGGTGAGALAASSPVSRRVRAFFAPVMRATGLPTIFDPAQMAAISLDALPAPWVDLGRCRSFVRRSGTALQAVQTGAPATPRSQVRTMAEATVEVEFESWGKLQLALSSGLQEMNLLDPAAGAAANGSGAVAASPVPLQSGSTATTLQVGPANAGEFTVGEIVAVDVDYTGQTGFVGSGASGGYVSSSAAVNGDVNYVRRVTLNVGLITAIGNGTLTLATPLLAGVPAAGMQVNRVLGFTDREGDGFFQEWSGLFCVEAEQGDRITYFYPRLQTAAGIAESYEILSGPLSQVRLRGFFRALATRDSNDGAMVVCYRSYLPAAMRLI